MSLQFKRSSISDDPPETSQVKEGELAISLADKIIYTNDGNRVISIGLGKEATDELYLPREGGTVVRIDLVNPPVSPGTRELVARTYVDTEIGKLRTNAQQDSTFVKLNGSTPMTGELILSTNNPVNANAAASKTYVDDQITNRAVLKSGSTMSGKLILSGDATSGNEAVTFSQFSTKLGRTEQAADSFRLGGRETNKFAWTEQATQWGTGEAWSTATLISVLRAKGAFYSPYWCSRGTWYYAGNAYVVDTGCGYIHLAGATVEVFCSNVSYLAQYCIRITTPSSVGVSGAYANAEFIYTFTENGYPAQWRRTYNTLNKPTLQELGYTPSNSGVSVSILTGIVRHGNWIPIPAGYAESQCRWMVSTQDSLPDNNGWDWYENNSSPQIRHYCHANGTRLVTCYVAINTNKSWGADVTFPGHANYIIIGVKPA